MSVYHLQRYAALKTYDQAGDAGVKLSYGYEPFKATARREFDTLSDRIFPHNRGDEFIRALHGLVRHKHIKKVNDNAYVITDNGKKELLRLEDCSIAGVNGSRPHNGVRVDTRQDYLFLKTAAERRPNQYEFFVDDMQAYGDEIFGEGNHHLHSDLYDVWTAEVNLINADLVSHGESDYEITEDGRVRLAKLQTLVAPAMVAWGNGYGAPNPQAG